MKTRHLFTFLLAHVLILCVVVTVSAQGPQPPNGEDSPLPPPPIGEQGPQQAHPSSPAVAVGQPGLSFRYVQTFGTSGEAYPNPGTTYLNSPSGLYIDGSDNLYVVEEHGYRLLRYTAGGVNTLVLGTAGLCIDQNNPAGYCVPQDVALDGSGNIWLATGSRVAEYDTNGVFLRQLPVPDTSGSWSSGSDNTHFNSSAGVAFDNTGHMFVSDSNNQRVQVYTFSGGVPVYSTTIGLTGVFTSSNAGFNSPRRVTVDSSNRLFVADANNGRVQRCVFSSTWSCTTLDGGLNTPRGVGIDGADNIYIADSDNHRVVKCNSGGSCSDLITNLLYGLDVAVDSGGNVFLDGWGHGVVRKYNSSGSFIGDFVGVYNVGYITNTVDINSPWGITVAADGSIYVTERNGYRVIKLNSAGVQQWALGMPGALGGGNYQFNTPQGKPAVTADNRVLVPDSGNSRIQIFTTGGAYVSTFGSSGTSGNDKFNGPNGIGLDPTNGDIYVADSSNQRVQVYDSNWVYKATLGVTGVSGSDNAHFNQPRDVAIDAGGNSYVADRFNRRIQKCSLSGISYTCTTFAGITGSAGSDFAHLNGPTGVALDSSGRVYVVDENNSGLQVYDASGAYLTTVGYSYGARTGQMRNASGVALDSAGNLYVTDRENHRIQKFTPGVPNWEQVNINGFGDAQNRQVTTLGVYNAQLYAGIRNSAHGAQLWRTSDGMHWTSIITGGFGITRNIGLRHMESFNNNLYVGTQADNTNGGEVWRSGDGLNWTRVVSQGFGDPTNNDIFYLSIFNGQIYAATNSGAVAHGSEIWRSPDGLGWTRVVSNGFGSSTNTPIPAMAVFSGTLYVGVNNPAGTELWRSSTGDEGSWTQANLSGFGEGSTNGSIHGLVVFNNMLYATTGDNGGQIWRSPDGTTWTKVITGGFGNSDNNAIEGLIAIGNSLFTTTNNGQTGMQVWRSSDGTGWVQISPDGFGDSNNSFGQRSDDVANFNGRFFTGTSNFANAAEVWELLDKQLFLPAIRR